jgi:glycosyltransferase involved in cell wall biosynthesis
MSDRLRVLYLAYYFPPLGGAGVQRAVKFARYLPEFGFEPVLVTGSGIERGRYAPLDASLAADASPGTEVVRTEGALRERSPGDRLRRLAGLPSAFERGWPAACESAALRAASSTRFDVILASMSPFETSRVAARLGARLGIPWVADLRDPWALDEMIVYPTRWHRGLELRRMRSRLASAALVVMNTPEAAHALRRAFPELQARTLAIPNGFDAEDFKGEAPAPNPDRFRIVHTGSLHVSLGLAHRRRRWLRRLMGGERVPVDILTRSHIHLLRALERWRLRAPDEVAQLDLILAGDLSLEDREAALRCAVADRVQMPGYLTHAESVALIRGADLLFLPMHALPRGERARIVPGKTYEYLAAGRPILGAVPEGDARDLVRASGIGDVCEPGDVEAMERLLRARFRARREGRAPGPVPAELLGRFERRALTARLAHALRSVIAREREPEGGLPG